MSVIAEQPTYTDPPARARSGLDHQPDRFRLAEERLNELPQVPAAHANADGETEQLGDVTVTHRFVDAPGDGDSVRWHFVECGPLQAPTAVFLHGVPDSWWQWHHALRDIGRTHHCLAVDLKGYGQSDKRTGDYRQEGVAAQLHSLLDAIGVRTFSLVTHDRGTPVGDHLVARLGLRVERYGRGQQHLWYLHPDLHPQEALFTGPDAHRILSDARRFVTTAYALLAEHRVADGDLARTIQEFSHPGIAAAVPRYFNSSSFRQEWLERRARLIAQWRCPVLLLQGAHDPLQPREFYTDDSVLERLQPGSALQLFDAGHFWPFEAPDEMCGVLREFLTF
jgi:pimeloyl-ACP methyl ester carboxylesterase